MTDLFHCVIGSLPQLQLAATFSFSVELAVLGVMMPQIQKGIRCFNGISAGIVKKKFFKKTQIIQ